MQNIITDISAKNTVQVYRFNTDITEAVKDFASEAYSIYTKEADRLVSEQMGLDTNKDWDEFETAEDSGEYELAKKLHDKAVVLSKYYEELCNLEQISRKTAAAFIAAAELAEKTEKVKIRLAQSKELAEQYG